jgi:hypothetical protein
MIERCCGQEGETTEKPHLPAFPKQRPAPMWGKRTNSLRTVANPRKFNICDS